MDHSASEYTQRVWKPSFALRPIIPCDNQRLPDGADIAMGDLRWLTEDNIASVCNPICYYKTDACSTQGSPFSSMIDLVSVKERKYVLRH